MHTISSEVILGTIVDFKTNYSKTIPGNDFGDHFGSSIKLYENTAPITPSIAQGSTKVTPEPSQDLAI